MSVRTGRKRGPKEKYPWAKWWALGKFTLTHGKDFHITPTVMTQSIRKRAGKDGIGRVSIRNPDLRTLEVTVCRDI